jgi:hypothetical protein
VGGVGGVDVVNGGVLVDAEDADQVDRVGGVASRMRSWRSRSGRTPSGWNMFQSVLVPTGPVSAAVCWLTIRCGLRLAGQR